MSREVETDMTDTELKPCPFCGSANLRFRDSDIEGWISHVECVDCDDMLGPMSEYKYDDVEDARADAANVWNRRALPRERGEVKEIIAAQVQSVCDWDDRTSPDDCPNHLLITPEELKEILENVADLASDRIRSCLLDKPEAVEGVTPERAARVLYDNWSGLNALPSPARELASQGHFFSALRLIFEPNADLRRPPAPAALTQEPTHE
ncbi:Lar family restriction alleviation protein [Sinorhizobium meliloti]|uniref:Lar family restriction alleviation protein n=1 Tax=Rhizobium meliloti TaxID=382 RepID=UPI000B49E6E0|nr:Lar family restriction alleviation protein [Sinorhizobium meliloti]ASP64431.1 restriction alleviation protein, Lar family [Sinorhizobium meliloti]MQX00826.1 restriction alleviation protein, Lar family [Sinorhizobium meliloti]RVG94031.1 restriction alleviation protein, Lar family [Sinorhizobium meliloti]RVH56204.1 restriction alleviation protein, Lar family [Sinorhizobium meliloti]RVK42058.1 restriction alleviation protein, Lar family [Sinorhizobium meliloti]